MSLTPLPPSPRKVCLWRIFFALPFRNGPLPAELKFRENTDNALKALKNIVCKTSHAAEWLADFL